MIGKAATMLKKGHLGALENVKQKIITFSETVTSRAAHFALKKRQTALGGPDMQGL